jgi:wyosine [tRNA(Phe)-imidazoG37] synthetase (radical SAM superfamily)
VTSSIVYGPVPSRRLGRSLGINNIPPKICSYSCVYCQLGRTLRMEAEPRFFYRTARIAEQARTKLEGARQKGEPIDYVTFVPDGEPTLDADLGREIEILKTLRVKIAVITNGSLLWREEVWQNVLKADWVSLKVDAVSEETWRRIDWPHKSLKLETILQGMLKFAETFERELTTETMLVRGVNDGLREIKKIAQFLTEFKPQKAYVAIPARPPAERVEPATEQTINTAYQVFAERLRGVRGVEYLIGYEGNAFVCTGNVQEDLLSITSVHPMREEAVEEFLENAGTSWKTVQHMIEKRDLVELEYQGKKFYMRRLPVHNVPRS